MSDTSKKIIIEFDKPLTKITGVEDGGYGTLDRNLIKNAILTANNESRGAVSNLSDGNTGTYWGTSATLPNWVTTDLKEPKSINKLRIYCGASYRINAFTLQGSNDNVIWTNIASGNCANATQWNEFSFTPVTYRYFKLNVTSRYSSYSQIYEMELISTDTIGNERAFTVTGKQYDHINGVLIDKNYEVTRVQASTLGSNFIELIIDPFTRFNNADGSVTVQYAQALGNLGDNDNAVQSFTQDFLPTALIPTPNPWQRERITLQPSISLAMTFINKSSAYGTERITLQPAITLVLKDVNGNPV